MATMTIRNGVDVDRLVATIGAIKEDPTVAKFTFRARSNWESGGRNRGEIGGFRETPSYNPDTKELHNAAIEPVCKKYLELRYQMMPYLYSAAKETCETGMPIIRAMWLHYPGEANAVGRGDQYLYGRDLLVAPIFEKGATSRSVSPPAATPSPWRRRRASSGPSGCSRPASATSRFPCGVPGISARRGASRACSALVTSRWPTPTRGAPAR